MGVEICDGDALTACVVDCVWLEDGVGERVELVLRVACALDVWLVVEPPLDVEVPVKVGVPERLVVSVGVDVSVVDTAWLGVAVCDADCVGS